MQNGYVSKDSNLQSVGQLWLAIRERSLQNAKFFGAKTGEAESNLPQVLDEFEW